MRPSRPQMFMEIAHVVAKRSTCMRLNVGAVLVQRRTIISIGYNGVPVGAPHCSGNDCPGKNHCHETIHAERNALIYAQKALGGIGWFNANNLDLYVTDSPCLDCFELIKDSRKIDRIFFATPYRINDHLIGDEDIGVYRVTPAGYIFNWTTKELVEVET